MVSVEGKGGEMWRAVVEEEKECARVSTSRTWRHDVVKKGADVFYLSARDVLEHGCIIYT
jgi:hypothetical protein